MTLRRSVYSKRRIRTSESIATQRQYDSFKTDTPFAWCWFCGRDESQRPAWWNAEWYLQRAHIVSSPRLEDVRLVNLMCPWCHGVEHGTRYCKPRPPITLANMLWIKERFDPANYAPDFMEHFSVGRLPKPEAPAAIYLAEYRTRRPFGAAASPDEIANLLAARSE